MCQGFLLAHVQYLCEQEGTIKQYVTEYLPEQYQVYLTALDTILKHAFEILYWYLAYQKHPKIESRTPEPPKDEK